MSDLPTHQAITETSDRYEGRTVYRAWSRFPDGLVTFCETTDRRPLTDHPHGGGLWPFVRSNDPSKDGSVLPAPPSDLTWHEVPLKRPLQAT